jgi:NAD-dependent deacetylase
MDGFVKKLKDMIDNSKKIVILSGAGISSESGIPTFRGVGGVWSKYDPDIYANINVFMKDSTYYWNYFKDERYNIIKKAKPNEAHKKIAELEKLGKIYRVITQNIDGLHQIAGSSNVIELHGNTRKINCLRCNRSFTLDEVFLMLKENNPPTCKCGGKLKPNTVLFGESLPIRALSEAEIAAKNCDLFLVLGSSLVVYPAAQLPIIAKEHSALLVIINLDSTPLDNIADLVINNSVSEVLSKVI